ncbi:MAG TPA: type IV secretory system conjugative DNA transfer family protein [Candidatus Baltobacteraceae bacterium]|nr:type IV secretory system conjugative DNA transfer family protein [Candidatus Baltobacteraceae bacterium]
MDMVALIAIAGLGLFTSFVAALEHARKERVRAAYDFNPQRTQAAGGFATADDLKRGGLLRRRGIRIGFSAEGRILRYGGAGHLLLVAAARTGKALTVLVTAILSLDDGGFFQRLGNRRKSSLIVVDPKAELAAITGHFRRRFGEVYVLNPFGILRGSLAGLKQGHYNPMTILDPLSRAFHATCDKLAEAICPDEAGGMDRHWIMSARLLISGVIAALAKFGAEADRNLAAVRNVVTGANGHSVFEFARECMNLPDPFVRQKLARFAARDAEESRELNGVISTADTQLGFIGNEAIAESLKGSDFDFHDLKRKPGTTVFVCLPLNKLDVCSAYFRLIMAAALSDLLEEGLRGTGAPVLAIIDETAQIGALRSLIDAWGMAAGAAGVQLFAVYQDVSQIINQFGKSWQTIVQNSGATLWFAARDQATRETVSKLAGVTEVLTRSRSVSIDHRTGEPHVSDTAASVVRPVIHPHEVGALKDEEMLVFCERVPGVIKAKREPYLKEFKGKYRDNPYFKEAGIGRWLRRTLFD